ncbi:neurospecific receptor kinase isoform X2 [Brevipalpus obovatus]|uniref:neurospecific receptor kinase isoform X2 n=1 Tax=Brevipalpus obovatus TaxID=246614 RepID=UPI003D9F3629
MMDRFSASTNAEIMSDSSVTNFCAPYQGKICENYRSNHFVYFNYTAQEQGTSNERITSALWKELIEPSNENEPCRKAAETLLCVYAFPDCDYSSFPPKSKPICREDCIAVRDSFCFNQWAMIEMNKKSGIYFKSRGHFRLPDCESLPSHSNQISPNCSRAHLTDMKMDEITYDCIKGKGRYYQGQWNRTRTGIPCQRWDVQQPHKHDRPPQIFPEIQNSENYCRNAGGEEPMPWCYTINPEVRWQHCDISTCNMGHTPMFGLDSSSASIVNDNLLVTSPFFAALLGSVALISIILLLVIVAICYRIRVHQKRNTCPSDRNLDIDLQKLQPNISYHCVDPKLNSKLEALEYPRNNIIYIRDIGQGAFGRVFQAKAPNIVKGEEFTMVAVKMLKDEATDDLLIDFEREACLMAEFDHPNIVQLLGVCAIGKPMCLLFEYMGRGDLNGFLRSSSPSTFLLRGSENISTTRFIKLTSPDLLNIATQIAHGMVYLSDRKFVHRDLATRNCLVSDSMVVKIADFGLSQRIYSSDYYKGSDQDVIPIRWMPLESIMYSKFSIESDVWAFGILLWEIFSFALQPYYGMTHEEVVQFLKDGNILSPPDDTPPSVCALMTSCWNHQANRRPTFRTIHKTLKMLLNEAKKNTFNSDRPYSASFSRDSSRISSLT